MRAPIILLLLLACALKSQAQLPPPTDVSIKLRIGFNKNVEFLGFMYFIGYEGTNIETKTLTIDGKEIAEKDWQRYGYFFYQKYKQYANSKHAAAAMGVADHLWLSDILPLLLQVPDFPNAKLTADIEERYYLPFAKDRNRETAKKNAGIFLTACNELYMEVNFDHYLGETSIHYRSALDQLERNLPSAEFITYTENFYRKKFERYVMLPSLTIPKGMGFGPRLTVNGKIEAYSIFGAVNHQTLADTAQLDMGFGTPSKIRELGIHEFGHSFVNPQFDQMDNDRIQAIVSLFEPLRSAMEEQGYNTWKACLNEHLVRAGEIMIAEKMHDQATVRKLKNEYINVRKFIYIPAILKELERFDADVTDKYPIALDRILGKLEKALPDSPAKPSFAFNDNPWKATFHTEDIELFWKVFDATFPKLSGDSFQQLYLDQGSIGLKGMIKNRIESGRNLSHIVRKQLKYYQYVRPFTLQIDEKKERIYECFENLKRLYPSALFPNVYFVIGANNTGGTIFGNGLIVGAERFGKSNSEHTPALDIEYVDELIIHEVVHFQQRYVNDNSLLAQCIKEGAADFVCELVAGDHSNRQAYVYGDKHKKELWAEFSSKMHGSDVTGWLYYSKDSARKDVGYWMGYQICRAYYDRMTDKKQAIEDIMNIGNFKEFFKLSGYEG